MQTYRMMVDEVFQKDFQANNRDEALKMAMNIACQHGYGNSGRNVWVQEIKEGIKDVGVEFETYDHVLKIKGRGYLFFKVNNEQEAAREYNEKYRGKRFWFNARKPADDGKNEYGRIIRTYYC